MSFVEVPPDDASRGGIPVRCMVDRSPAEIVCLFVGQVVPAQCTLFLSHIFLVTITITCIQHQGHHRQRWIQNQH